MKSLKQPWQRTYKSGCQLEDGVVHGRSGGPLGVVGFANDQGSRLLDPLVRRGPAAIGNINVSTAWYALFGIRLVHVWSSWVGNGAASAAIVDWRLTKARPGKLGESSQPARRTDAERAGGMCG